MLTIILSVVVSGCIDVRNTNDIKEIKVCIDDVEALEDCVVVHFKDDGLQKFYPDEFDEQSVSNLYVQLRSYQGHNVTIMYYDNYYGNEDVIFYITLR